MPVVKRQADAHRTRGLPSTFPHDTVRSPFWSVSPLLPRADRAFNWELDVRVASAQVIDLDASNCVVGAPDDDPHVASRRRVPSSVGDWPRRPLRIVLSEVDAVAAALASADDSKTSQSREYIGIQWNLRCFFERRSKNG
jgi:hypothetical protein